jgi:uncharacterized repeat protein (TIGR02543 family)
MWLFNRRGMVTVLAAVLAVIGAAQMTAAQTMSNPLPYLAENFDGGKPAANEGWSYGLISASWESSGGVYNTGCLKGSAMRGLIGMDVVTPYVAMGAKPMVSFAFAAYDHSNSESIVTWEVQVATVEGTTATWNSKYYHDDISFTNSSGFRTIAVDLSAVCANRTAKVQIALGINTKVSNSNSLDLFLDDVTVRSDYAVVFDASGGLVNPAYGVVGESGKLFLPTPTRTNFSFVGWFTDPTGGTQVTNETVLNPGAIYAHWKVINATFIFEEFTGTTTPTGWTYSGFSRQTSGGRENSACLRANIYSSSKKASVTIPNVALGANAQINFLQKEEGRFSGETVASGAMSCSTSVSTDGGTTWKTVGFSFVGGISGFTLYTTPLSLSAYANQIVTIKIVFTWFSDDIYVWLDNIRLVGARYTIEFDANGGMVSTTSGMTNDANDQSLISRAISARKINSLPTPTRDGYAFNGWFTDKNGGTAVTSSTIFSADTTIYARWTPIYTVVFDATAGTVTTVSGTTNADGKLSSLPTPTKTGYTFNGWFTDETGGEKVTTSTIFTANTAIYARWTLITYTVTFNANSGTVTPTTATTGVGGTLASLPTPMRTGYTFAGWFTTLTGGTEVTENRKYSANATIYAHWTQSTYNITFDAAGGAVTPVTMKIDESGRVASLPTPTRAGYDFDGWFTAEAGGTAITTSTVFSGDATIYARWTPVYAVTFSSSTNGVLAATVDGNPITTGVSVQHGKSVIFTAIPDDGYCVSGWSINGAAVNGNTSNTYTLSGVSAATTVTVSFEKTISLASPNRVIPQPNSSKETAIVAPVNRLAAEFTVGPNPVGKSSGAVKFFRQGSRIASAPLLVIYDASGNVVKKVGIADKATACGNDRRAVGSWNLKDAKGRPVPEGEYLVKGVVKAANGKREKVSVVVGVR